MITSDLFDKKQLGLAKISKQKMINFLQTRRFFTAEPQRTQRQVDFPLPFGDTDQRKRVQMAAMWFFFVSG